MPVGFQTGVDMTNAALNRMRSGGGGGGKMSKREKKLMDEEIKRVRQERKFDKKDRKEAAKKRELLDPKVLKKLDRKEAKSAIKGRIQENRKQKHLNEKQKLANEREQKLQDAQNTAGYFTFKGEADAETEYAKLRASQLKRARDQSTEKAAIELDAEKRKLSAELTKAEVANDLTVSQTRQNNATAQQTETDNLTRKEHNRSVIRLNDANAKDLAANTSETLHDIGRKKKDAEQKVRDEDSFKGGIADVGVLVDMARNSSDPESTIALAKGIVDDLTSAAARLGPAHTKKLEEFTTKTFPELLSKFRAGALHKEKERIQATEDVMAVMLEAKSKANPAFRRQYDSWTPEMKREHDVTALVRRKINETGNVHMNQLMNDSARKGMFIKYKLHNDPNQRWAMDAKGNQLKTKDGELVPNLIIDEDATFAALDSTLAQYKAMGPLPRSKRQSSVAGKEEIPATAAPVVPAAGAAAEPPEPIRLVTDTDTVATEGTPHPWGEKAWQDYQLAQNAPSTAAELLSSMEGGAGEHDLWLAQQGALEALSAADQQRLAQWTTAATPPTPTITIPGYYQAPAPPAPTVPKPSTATPAPAPTEPTEPTQPQSQQAIPDRMKGVTIAGASGKPSRPFNATAMHTAMVKRLGGNQPTMAAEVIEFMGEVGMELDKGTPDEAINAAKLMARTNVEGSYGANQLMSDNLRPRSAATKKLAPRFKGSLIESVRKTLFGDSEWGGMDVDVEKLYNRLNSKTVESTLGIPSNYWEIPAKEWRSEILIPMTNGDMDDSDKIKWTPEKVKTFKRRVESWKKWKAFKDKIDQIK